MVAVFVLLIVYCAVGILSLRTGTVIKSNRLSSTISRRSDYETSGKPKWAGGGPVSDIANALIASPLFKYIKSGARQFVIDGAVKKGIDWNGNVELLQQKQKQLDELFTSIENKNIEYPWYYTQEFHAYSEGNLNWLAAYECESATLATSMRLYPKETIDYTEAQARMRGSIHDAVDEYRGNKGLPKRVLDVGCSVGMSTFAAADRYKSASIEGLDLSPHFLAVAKYKQSLNTLYKRIKWIHANAEFVPTPQSAYDLVMMSYVVHELPTEPSKAILREMYRVMKTGGTISICDNNPKSKIIQNLPAPVFAMMKSTEPFSDQYYTFDIEAYLADIGFTNIKSIPVNPRHRTILASK